jgi:hypothetical protein
MKTFDDIERLDASENQDDTVECLSYITGLILAGFAGGTLVGMFLQWATRCGA